MARLSSLSSLPCIRILVLGDSGVGKTSLVHSLSASPQSSPSTPLTLSTSTSAFAPASSSFLVSSSSSVSWTIGCQPQTLLLPSSYPSQGGVFVQLFDVGGHRKYAGSRSMFYHGVDGVLLVFDVGNHKSYRNLARWMRELVDVDSRHPIEDDWTAGGGGRRGGGGGGRGALASLPVLVVGNKADTVEDGGRRYDAMKDYGLEMAVTAAVGMGREQTLHLLTPFIHSVVDRKERGGGERSHTAEESWRAQGQQPLLRGPVYSRKTGGSGGGGSGRLRGGDARGEEAEEEDEGDGMTIDMEQLELLSTPAAPHPQVQPRRAAAGLSPVTSASSLHRLSAGPPLPSSTSSLSRYLPARLLAFSGGGDRGSAGESPSRV